MDIDNSEKEVNKIDYSINAKNIGKMAGIFGIIFAFTFLFNFPLMKLTEDKIRFTLENNRACPITFDKLELSFLLPKVSLDHVNISGNCIRRPNDLIMDMVTTKVICPSFSPFGIATQTNFDFLSNHWKFYFPKDLEAH